MINTAVRMDAGRCLAPRCPKIHLLRTPLTMLAAAALLCGALAGDAVARQQPTLANPPRIEPAVLHHAPVCHAANTIQVTDSPLGNNSLTPAVIHALCAASVKAQADPFLLLAIAWQESRFDPTARNRFSSARGLLQFTTTTWLTVIHDFGARYGLARFANAIRTDRDGRIWVSSRALRRQILALRNNPELEAIMAAEWLAQQKTTLAQEIGRPATLADLYLLHLLGPSGAKDFLVRLTHSPKTPSIDVVGHVAAKPNMSLFVQDGRRLTLTQTYEYIQQLLNQQVVLHAGLFAPAG